MPPSDKATEKKLTMSVGNNVGSGKVRSDFSDVPDNFVLPAGDAERGRRMFKKYCAQCHSIYPDNRITQAGATQLGPTLFGVYGRASGQEEIQQKVLMGDRAEGLVWTDGPLMNYMKNPRQAASANVQMNFRGIEDFQLRVDIIHYLKTLTWSNKELSQAEVRPPSYVNVFPLNVIYHTWTGK